MSFQKVIALQLCNVLLKVWFFILCPLVHYLNVANVMSTNVQSCHNDRPISQDPLCWTSDCYKLPCRLSPILEFSFFFSTLICHLESCASIFVSITFTIGVVESSASIFVSITFTIGILGSILPFKFPLVLIIYSIRSLGSVSTGVEEHEVVRQNWQSFGSLF